MRLSAEDFLALFFLVVQVLNPRVTHCGKSYSSLRVNHSAVEARRKPPLLSPAPPRTWYFPNFCQRQNLKVLIVRKIYLEDTTASKVLFSSCRVKGEASVP